ncbi:thiolase family protein [Rhizobiales bacterium]|uniref:thiolase family protein n=1 Tax=Hongsoonwoonella zoysiae TaxID=2821844 RepID=UPI0015601B5D|nr:thiolase family protein [Hongsoonwoonella zoysiae]NRG17200.1 thiolase family protein [Hongsoonwoonella zoysiae]
MTRPVFVIAAKRSAVVPRGGAFKAMEVDEMAAPVIADCLDAAGVTPGMVDDVIIGNGLYGSGNPARRIALLAGIPEGVSATTLDRQCCSGLDAIGSAARLIATGEAECVLAGGVESFSRSPIRLKRPLEPGNEPEPYDRPPFSPWPERDPDMGDAAANLAKAWRLSTDRQIEWTCDSHRKALEARSAGDLAAEIVPINETSEDAYTRKLSPAVCRRSKRLAGDEEAGVLAATTAAEADAAAFVLVISEKLAGKLAPDFAVRITGVMTSGGDPGLPGLAPIDATKRLFERSGVSVVDIAVAEVMEAYAAQAIACVEGLGLDPAIVNQGGGALARGHPIGASGAVLAVRLFEELRREGEGAKGLVTIAAAGGLATSVLIERV